IYVKPVLGKMEVSWPGDYGEIHTKILERMKKVLMEDTIYPYLKPNAQKRIDVARNLAINTGMLEHSIVSLGGYTYCLFPWLGTRSFRTLRKFIQQNSKEFKINNMEFEGCCYMIFKMESDSHAFIDSLVRKVDTQGIDCASLVSSGELPVFEKYDDYIPGELLREAYSVDKLRADEAEKRLHEILTEW
ncbi:MAG: ATP-dependent helicase, partial [Clostridia bacterium]|nr:ATP-dependent helicase [Clostridia bacterium]